ncbi:concanavalin a-like lectin/glucanases superfamily domain-containing protein [Ditylenchus destructor]|uniref:Concanavalin a-like lectin/glucanases superfamily domain-containing protein n=1 Tax=Ditylenchus destructor TaxID=166010 RepID=A0AAD4QV29_9BILA|nr:concanavalin a-like lectin/glucanases superfamily domain-containing protein [Ditylenchus destructor]
MPHRSTLSRCLFAGGGPGCRPRDGRRRCAHAAVPCRCRQGLEAVVAQGEAVPNFRDKVDIVDGRSAWQGDPVAGRRRAGLGCTRQHPRPAWHPRLRLARALRGGRSTVRESSASAFADHSSWDMAWLRIDWNGHGFDAFVTDANLARTRVSFRMDTPPRPDQWLHLAFAWDEDQGVRLFVDGREVARAQASGDYDAALDQLGLAGRVMAPYQVQSRYNFLAWQRFFPHIRVYDRMLDAAAVSALARGKAAPKRRCQRCR